MTDPVTRTARSGAAVDRVSTAKPTAARREPPAITKAGRTRRTITGVSIEPTMNPAAEGTVHSPASNGDSPSTSCRYWAMKTQAPNATKKASVYAASAALKAGTRKSRRSISGSASVRCRRTNTVPTARPATIDSAGRRPEPVLGDLLEAVDHRQHGDQRQGRAEQVQPARLGIPELGQQPGPTASSSTITGTPSRNTEPHQKYSRSSPPTSGPIAPPAEKLVIHTPMANVRCCGSRNMLRIRDRVDGAKRRPGNTEQRAGGDQHLGAGRERGEHRGDAERGRADQEQPAAADAVAQRAHGDQRARRPGSRRCPRSTAVGSCWA